MIYSKEVRNLARRVFFSFHYKNDINRSMTVRNSWVTQGKEAAGFIDKADFEKVKLQLCYTGYDISVQDASSKHLTPRK